MTRRIEELDVPRDELEQQLRELTASREKAVAELPPITWRPQDKTPKSTSEEAS